MKDLDIIPSRNENALADQWKQSAKSEGHKKRHPKSTSGMGTKQDEKNRAKQNRAAILAVVDGNKTIREIAKETGLSDSGVAMHLRTMALDGLVQIVEKRVAQSIYGVIDIVGAGR